jgi:glycolate dehydrogenase FAD-linked subunit
VSAKESGIYHIRPARGPRLERARREAMARSLSRILGEEAVRWKEPELLVYDADGLVLEKFWPDLVVLPESAEQVREVLRFAAREKLPLMARGAGTGLCGGSLAERGGIVLSLARLDKILAIDPEDRCAVVQPGVVNLDLSRAAAPHGLYYAPDPSSQMSSTVGGNFATNAGGPHCLKYGQTHRHILSVEMVMADGDTIRLGDRAPGGPAQELLSLMIGSEGTLGVATELTVRLLRVPETVRTFLASFETVEAASRAVTDLIAAGIVPAALEMIDHLTIVAVEPYVHVGLPMNAGAALLIELDGPTDGMDRRARQIEALCAEHGAMNYREAKDDTERALLWKARKGAFGAMGRIANGFYVMDGVVPRTKLPEMLARVGRICEERGLRVANVFHAGDGNLHPNVLFDPDDPGEVSRALDASFEILRACVALGGSLSGEHGIGNEKREMMGLVFSKEDLEVMRSVKTALDPAGTLNPDKIFPTGEPPWRPEPVRAAAARDGAWI